MFLLIRKNSNFGSSLDANETGTDSLTMEENKVEAYNKYCTSMTNEEESLYSLETFAKSNAYTNAEQTYKSNDNNNNNNSNKSAQRTSYCKFVFEFINQKLFNRMNWLIPDLKSKKI